MTTTKRESRANGSPNTTNTTASVQDAQDASVGILYVRVSTLHQAEEGASLDAQEAELRQLAKAHTPELRIIVLREEGKSGRSGKKRPKYEQAKAHIRDGQVGAIYATKTDRLGRSVHEYLEFLALCHDAGTAVFTKNGKVENTATGKLLAGFLGIVAQFESDLRSERVKEVIEHLRDDGYWTQGRAPWGYRRGDDRILYKSADGHLIRAAFDRADEGAGPMEVTRFLIGAPKEERETVDLAFVQKILRNAVYAGYVTADTKSGAPTLIEGQHGPNYGRDPLVPRDLFSRVQEKLDERRTSRTREDSGLSPFGPLARCGSCRAVLRVKRLQDGGYAYFECGDACGKVSPIPTEQLELWTVAYLSVIPRLIEQLFESGQWRILLGNQDEARRISERILELETGRENIRALARTGALDPSEADADLQANTRELRTLREEYEHHAADEDIVRADLERLAHALDYGFDGENIAQFWQHADTKGKREALESVLDRLDLHDGCIGLTFKYGLWAWSEPAETVLGALEDSIPRELVSSIEPGLRARLPLVLPAQKHRRTPKRTAQYEALGFLGLSFDVAPSRLAATADSQTRISTGDSGDSESVAKSRSARRGRSAGRSPSPPCAGRRARGSR